jgi:hypothetical protein
MIENRDLVGGGRAGLKPPKPLLSRLMERVTAEGLPSGSRIESCESRGRNRPDQDGGIATKR